MTGWKGTITILFGALLVGTCSGIIGAMRMDTQWEDRNMGDMCALGYQWACHLHPNCAMKSLACFAHPDRILKRIEEENRRLVQ